MRKYLVLSSLIASALALGAGCKTDDAVPATSGGSAASSSSTPTATETGKPRRSAKIELPSGRQRPAAPSLDTGAAAADESDDAEARREAWRQRREDRRLERRAALDADGDGEISPKEREIARQQRMEEMRSRLDTDGDGKLTVSELEGSRMARRLGDVSQLDTDGNGEVSVEEMQASMQRMRERVRERRGDRGRFGGPGAGSDAR